MNLSSVKQKIVQLPQNPGVYFFKGATGEILYIGKATNLRSRVQSYFRGADNRGEWIARMVSLVADIDFQETDSVLEALILESNLIKKYLPKYNTMEKDDKSFAYFVVTKEEYPRVLIMRKTDLLKISNFKFQISNDKSVGKNFKYKDIAISSYFGPYTSKYQMQVALKIIRRIFPFHALKQKSEKGCLDYQLGTCPGPYDEAISKEDYRKNIRGIRMILEGKKKRLVSTLEKEMKEAAKNEEFEKAADLRNKIYALEHIRDIALMTKEFEDSSHPALRATFSQGKKKHEEENIRIEAYDISNIGGQQAVASMVVFSGGKPDKSQYRKFKIKTVEGSNDVAMMREVLLRRFKNDWTMPDLIILDGGQGHFNMGVALVRELGLAVDVAAVAKGPTRKKLEIRVSKPEAIGSGIRNFLKDEKSLKYIMDEAHRFAIGYHRKVRGKELLGD